MGGSLYLLVMRDLIKNILLGYLNEDKALYTVEELRQLALKYQNFKEFLKNEPKALAAIRRKGKDFENELTGHMDRSHYKNWSDDDLRREALKYQTISDFQKNSVLISRNMYMFNLMCQGALVGTIAYLILRGRM